MICEFCEYEFDDSCGRYGCPNYLGEGLDVEKMVVIPVGMEVVKPSEQVELRLRLLTTGMRMHLDPFKHALNTRWRKHFNDLRRKGRAKVLPLQ